MASKTDEADVAGDDDEMGALEDCEQDDFVAPESEGEDEAEDAEDGECEDEDDGPDPHAAQWMSGKWGVGWRLAAGDTNTTKVHDVDYMVDSVRRITGASYVLFNLSNAASGDRYLAPHSVLSEISPRSCPARDLFGELATAFQAAGYKVLCYMATEGPAKLHHKAKHAFDYDKKTERSPSVDNWVAYVSKRYGSDDVDTLKRAYAEVIVKEYAERYGSKIDGWWFDHASFGNKRLLRKVVKKANPKTVVAFNSGRLGWTYNANPGLEDYTFGHPVPVRRGLANSEHNLRMVKDVEKSNHGYVYRKGRRGPASLGHLYMPLHKRWNVGKRNVVWPEEQAVDWMGRVLGAGGAWTWNACCDRPDGVRTCICEAAIEFAARVGARLEDSAGEGEG